MADLASAFGLSGHHALITGGGSGIGLAAARCMREAGAAVTIVGSDAAKLSRAKAELGDVSAMAFDVTAVDTAEDFAARVADAHGPVSILVNNAGNTVKKPVDAMTPADFQSVLDVHVSGAFALTRAFLPQIAAHCAGSVLFTASMASFLGIPEIAGYSAAKAALVGLTRSLATELAPRGVRVNAVAPGWIDTPLFRSASAKDPARVDRINRRIPMGRFGTPEEIGLAMVYLASPAAAYVTGQVLAVDGGALHAF